ncbi:MAG: hypothetical protein M3N98_00115 [Actinomycetota bacterium]|nr:hypothetical protein [Actinomycetota bacterium]
MLYLVGLHDDYLSDGRVLTEDLTNADAAVGGGAFKVLAGSYKQLNASVGRFGTSSLIAATHGIERAGPNDAGYRVMTALLSSLATQRDVLAGEIKSVLDAAEFGHQPVLPGVAASLTARSESLQLTADLYSRVPLP